MKLKIDTERNVVSTFAEKTATLDMVVSLSRVTVGLAIGCGLLAAGMAAIIGPGEGGGSAPVIMKAVAISGATSVMDAQEHFVAMHYYLGSVDAYQQTSETDGQALNTAGHLNQPLSIQVPPANTNTNGGGPTSFSIESISNPNGPTSFSIEQVPMGTFPAQMIFLKYRLANDATVKTMTICLGRGATNTVYVGTDGSTYANYSLGVLTGRTTSQSCASIIAKALKFTSFTNATRALEGNIPGNGSVVFGPQERTLGTFDSTGVFVPGSTLSIPFPDDPLQVGPSLSITPTDGVTYTFPHSIVQLIGYPQGSSTAAPTTVCLPQMTILRNGTTYTISRFFFDTTGTPYSDIFLETPAMTGTCAQAIAKSLQPSSISQASVTVGALPTWASLNFLRNQTQLGVLAGSGFTVGQSLNPNPMGDPLAVQISGNSGKLLTTFTLLSLSVTWTDAQGASKSTSLCVPTQAYQTSTSKTNTGLQFYDNTGHPYKDIFLTTPIVCLSN